MDIIKETQNGTKLLDVIGLSLRKHKKRLEFLPIHGSTALTLSGQISSQEEILRIISDDNYYLQDLSEECSFYLPRMNIREICICWSINKLELYQSSCGELLTQLCIETLSTHQSLKKIHNSNIESEYVRHGLELMYNSGQIDNELISKHCNELIQTMISIESEANSRIRDKYIDLDTIGNIVINHGNDTCFSNCCIVRTQPVHSLSKHFVGERSYNTSTINEKMWFLNGESNIMKFSSSFGTLGFNYKLRLLDNDLFNY